MARSVDIDLQLLRPETVTLLERVADEVFNGPIDVDKAATYAAVRGHFLLVAVFRGEVIGQCSATIHHHPDKQSDLYIDEVGVTPSMRRRGVAHKLLSQMFDIGKQHGCEEACVSTESDNFSARALYASVHPTTGEPSQLYVYEI